jgi:DNA-binding response OmpR family regulator
MNSLQGRKILVIDDDPMVLGLLEYTLYQAGAEVYTSTSGEEGLLMLPAHEPDLIVLDVTMPGTDGWQICRRMRQITDIPIIFLSAETEDRDVIQGLDCGAVDYVTKPFGPRVLLARVRAALRQLGQPAVTDKPTMYQNGHLSINLETRQVLRQGEPVKLSTTEHRLLAFLLCHADQPLTFQRILEEVWGPAYQDCLDLVFVYISRLRRKLEEDPKNPEYLVSDPGSGYRFQI